MVCEEIIEKIRKIQSTTKDINAKEALNNVLRMLEQPKEEYMPNNFQWVEGNIYRVEDAANLDEEENGGEPIYVRIVKGVYGPFFELFREKPESGQGEQQHLVAQIAIDYYEGEIRALGWPESEDQYDEHHSEFHLFNWHQETN